MIKIINFDNCKNSNIGYGGHSGSKRGIIYNNEKWFIKYPKNTKSMDNVALSYTTMPISEYLGSKIYESVGLATHETVLGFADGKIVVACKDFLKSNEDILDYNAIKNNYDAKVEEYILKHSSSTSNFTDDINELIFIMDNNRFFKEVPDLKKHFWDLFIIDALINNNDRNEGNWGLIINRDTYNLSIAPVYDNGAAFYGKSDDEKLKKLLLDDNKFIQVAYDSSTSVFRENDKIINPLKYIESMKCDECNRALLRIIPKINLNEIKKIFDEIPSEYNGEKVFSKNQKEFYYRILEYRYNKVLMPIYNKLFIN